MLLRSRGLAAFDTMIHFSVYKQLVSLGARRLQPAGSFFVRACTPESKEG